ncbi:MAG: TraX family protein [Bacillales bacterium]
MAKFKFNNQHLKLIALLTMTVNHVFLFLDSTNIDVDRNLAYLSIIFGRIAFPIFIFLFTETMHKSKNLKRKIIDLGIMSLIIYFLILIYSIYCYKNKINDFFIGNIFLTFFLLGSSYYLLKLKNKLKLFSMLPILYLLSSFIFHLLVLNDVIKLTPSITLIFFSGLYPQYALLSILLFYGFIISFKIYDMLIIKKVGNDDFKKIKELPSYQNTKNIIASINILLLSIIFHFLNYLEINKILINLHIDYAIYTYISLAIIFILFYNGKLYNKFKFPKYLFYIYYPLHLIILTIIFLFINK